MTTQNTDALNVLLQLTDEPGSNRSPIANRYPANAFVAVGTEGIMRTASREVHIDGNRFLVQVVLLAIAVCVVGCAGTTTREALTLRSPAQSFDVPENQAERRDWNLRHALDLAIKRQEQEDKLDQLMWLK
jgi:hypothetical protein